MTMNILQSLQISNSVKSLRGARNDAKRLQALVEFCAKAGCDSDDMGEHLGRAGVPSDQITTLLAAAYPTA
jgi:hypothetical protein